MRHVAEPGALVGERSADDLPATAPRGGPLRLRNRRPRNFDKAVKAADLAGADVHQVARTMLGHRKPNITRDTCGHLRPDRLAKVTSAERKRAARPMCNKRATAVRRVLDDRCGCRPDLRGQELLKPTRGIEPLTYRYLRASP
ncbi:hypothetical protein GCM10027570_03380 [Streptomonospora sediminis]